MQKKLKYKMIIGAICVLAMILTAKFTVSYLADQKEKNKEQIVENTSVSTPIQTPVQANKEVIGQDKYNVDYHYYKEKNFLH